MSMAYDNFENTPFDLNHDGHIDSNEAAYIYETFYSDYNDSNTDDCFVDERFEGNISDNSEPCSRGDARKGLDVDCKWGAESDKRLNMSSLIPWGIVILIAILFPDSQGIAVFVGMLILSAKISSIS